VGSNIVVVAMLWRYVCICAKLCLCLVRCWCWDKWLGVLCCLHAVHLATSHLSHCTPSLNKYEHDAKGTLDANEDCGEKEVW